MLVMSASEVFPPFQGLSGFRKKNCTGRGPLLVALYELRAPDLRVYFPSGGTTPAELQKSREL